MNKEPSKISNIVIIGGGPSGTAAAISAGIRAAKLPKSNIKIHLLDKNSSLGRKLLMTGQGRCNITHTGTNEMLMAKFFRGGDFLRDAFNELSNKDLILFFKQRGLRIIAEKDGRCFPETNRAVDVLRVIVNEMRALAINIWNDTKCTGLIAENGKITGVKCGDKTLNASAVIIATGGNTYRHTGSSGDGYEFAGKTGHVIVNPTPALSGINISKPYLGGLQGIVLSNVLLTASSEKKKLVVRGGDLLFTHEGISGPAVLSISGHINEQLAKKQAVHIDIDLIPDMKEPDIGSVTQQRKENSRRTIKAFLRSYFPERFTDFFLKAINLDGSKLIVNISKNDKNILLRYLKQFRVEVCEKFSYDQGMVTRGGVSLKDVDPRTMASRKVRGLFFAGEVLDIDAETGGYNLQAAFSTGWTAGAASISKICNKNE